jgi:DHA1 family bicyclomycin/chloramphenicol resistance-like MFS transporter
MLTASAPLSIDMYLPALPTMERVFGVTGGRVQLTLASFFFGFAVSQAFYGPVSDRFGRKPPMYFGLILFVAASAGCAIAESIEMLIALRLLQAVGACAGGVIARAMVRDLFDPKDTASVYGSLMLVMGLAPALAPLIGGYILIFADWRTIFWVLAAYALVALAAVTFALPETHAGGEKGSLALGRVLGGYWRLLSDRIFLGYGLLGGVSIAGMFVYIAGSPFVFITLFEIAPEHYAWIFGVNSVGFIITAQLNSRLVKRMSSDQIISIVGKVQASAGIVLAIMAATGTFGVWGIIVPLFAYLACLGMILPNSTAMAMAPHARNAGMASALLGVLQFGLAGVASTVIGAIHSVSAIPMAGLIAVCGVGSVFVYRLMIRRARAAAP